MQQEKGETMNYDHRRVTMIWAPPGIEPITFEGCEDEKEISATYDSDNAPPEPLTPPPNQDDDDDANDYDEDLGDDEGDDE